MKIFLFSIINLFYYKSWFQLLFLIFVILLPGCDQKRQHSEITRSVSLKIGLPAHFEVPFTLPDIKVPVFPDRQFPITDFGAEANKAELVTIAIERAIEACHNAGGGMVVIPAGIWQSGPIHLKSNVNLHLAKDAEIRFSGNFDDYLPVQLISRGGYFCYTYSPPVYARGCENIAITGEGILNGQGHYWWPWKQNQPGMKRLFEMGKANVPIEQRVFGTVEDGVRPPFIQFLECKNILIEGITVKDGPSWNIHPVHCDDIVIRGVSVIAKGPNNDGIDPDGCRNVLIEDCYVDVGDDNICLKSGRDEEARAIGRVCENVIVRRCRSMAGHGGFVIGSEMSAGVRNVLVYDCHFEGTNKGIRLKSRMGRGGIVENVYIRDIHMNNIKNEAITLSLQYDAEPIERAMNYAQMADAYPPTFRNIHIENIKAEHAGTAIELRGLPTGNHLNHIYLKNIEISAKNEGVEKDVQQIFKEDVNIILTQ